MTEHDSTKRGGKFIAPPGGEMPNQELRLQEIKRGDLIVRAAGGYYKIVVDGVEVRNPEIDVAPFHHEGLQMIDGMLVSLGQWRDHTFLIGLKDILPEDLLWRQDRPKLPALVCAQDDHGCDCPWGCLRMLGKRILWLFEHYDHLEQVLVLFKRDEKELWRKMGLDMSYSKSEEDVGIKSPKVRVPRFWVLYVPRGFTQMLKPYRLFRSNYDGLCHILRGTKELRIGVPFDFWMGGVS